MATQEVIETIQTYNFNLFFGGCFFVQWENRNVNKSVLEDLKTALGDKMLDTCIRKNKDVDEVTYKGIPLLKYSKNGTATEDYMALTAYIQTIV